LGFWGEASTEVTGAMVQLSGQLGVSPTDQQILGKSLILGSLLLGGGELKLLSLECRTALGAAKGTAFQTGVNITPRSVANNYRTIGRGGRTFVTESSAVEGILGPLKGNRISITGQQARQLENALGLNPNSLEARNILSIVDNVPGRVPRVPTSGNSLFQGAGAGLPGGGAELTIQGIPSPGGQGIRQIILEVIK